MLDKKTGILSLFIDAFVLSLFAVALEYFFYFICQDNLISFGIFWRNIINYTFFFTILLIILSIIPALSGKKFLTGLTLYLPVMVILTASFLFNTYRKKLVSFSTILIFFIMAILVPIILALFRKNKRKLLIFLEILFCAFTFSYLSIQRILFNANFPEAIDGNGIIVVLVDALRADMINEKIMPFTYSLAKKSLYFTNAHSAASATIPSIFALFTGKLPYFFIEKGSLKKIIGQELTIAQILRKRGYTTIGVSSNLLICKELGFSSGFQKFLNVGIEWRRFALYRFPQNSYFQAKGIKLYKFLEVLPFRIGDGANVLNYEAVKIIKKYAGKKVFIYLHYMDTHSPYGPPKYILKDKKPDWNHLNPGWHFKMINGFPEIEFYKYPENIERAFKTLYKAEAKYFDSKFSELMTVLKRTGFMNKGTIIFLADHGEAFREHGELSHGNFLYEELIRVPLFIFSRDIKPTTVNSPVNSNFTVYNFLKKGGTIETGENSILSTIWSIKREGKKQVYSLINSTLKTIGTWRLYKGKAWWEFHTYNLEEDPGEKFPLETNENDRGEILKIFKQLNQKSSKIKTAPSKEYLNKLKSLGYVK